MIFIISFFDLSNQWRRRYNPLRLSLLIILTSVFDIHRETYKVLRILFAYIWQDMSFNVISPALPDGPLCTKGHLDDSFDSTI